MENITFLEIKQAILDAGEPLEIREEDSIIVFRHSETKANYYVVSNIYMYLIMSDDANIRQEVSETLVGFVQELAVRLSRTPIEARGEFEEEVIDENILALEGAIQSKKEELSSLESTAAQYKSTYENLLARIVVAKQQLETVVQELKDAEAAKLLEPDEDPVDLVDPILP